VPLVGMIPEPADIGNQFAVVIDERIIDCNDAVLGVAGAGVALQQIQPTLIKGMNVPLILRAGNGWTYRH